MNKFLLRYLPVFQMPDAGGTGGASPSSAPGPSVASPAPVSTPSPAPSPAPSSAPSPSEVEPADASDNVDFSMIFGDGEPTPPPPETPPAAQPEVKPAAGAEPAQPATPPVAQPAAPPAGTAAPAPTELSSGAQPQLDPYDPGALSAALAANEVQAIEHVASTMFKLNPEEIEALETNTVEAVPKLLAKSFVKMQQNMLLQMARMIPGMIQKQTVMMQRHGENEQKFYARWPDLKKDVHGEKVMQYAAVYRQMNPAATLEQVIDAVGPMVMMASGVTPSVGGGTASLQGVQPSPMAPAVGTRPQPSPFVPAAPNGGGASPQQVPDVHPAVAMLTHED